MIINASHLNNIYRKKYGTNTYSYAKIKNLLNGVRGNTTKKEIQQIRQILKTEVSNADKILETLENNIS